MDKTMNSAAVIIPTTGRPTLRQAVRSVLDQTWPDVVAVVVVDGPQFGPDVLTALDGMLPHPRIQLMPLPQNTGDGGYQGHRIYGAAPLLANQDWILFLDDDNWFEPDHVAECVGTCVENGLEWCAAMRNIVDENGDRVCVDECESLGVEPVWYDEKIFHVDTSCYCISREIAIQLSLYWHRPHVPDAAEPARSIPPDEMVCRVLRQDAPKYALIARPTVNYRIGSRKMSAAADFFVKGNAEIRRRHGGFLAWGQRGPAEKIERSIVPGEQPGTPHADDRSTTPTP